MSEPNRQRNGPQGYEQTPPRDVASSHDHLTRRRRVASPTKGAAMPRLTPIDPATATGEAKRLLDGIQATFGRTPNSFRAMANSPAVLKGWIELNGALETTLTRKLGEQIAIAIAEQNGC